MGTNTDNQGLSDGQWALWAASIVTNHGSSLAIITSTVNINSVLYTSTGGLAMSWASDAHPSPAASVCPTCEDQHDS